MMFSDRGWNFGMWKTLIGENDNSGSISVVTGRSHVVQTNAKIHKVKALVLILLKLSLAH